MIKRVLFKSCKAAVYVYVLLLAAVAYPQCTLVITDPPCNAVSANLTAASVTAGSATIGTLTYWTNPNATVPLANPAAVTTSGVYYIKNTVGACSDIKRVRVTIGTAAPTATPFLHTECSAAQTTANSIFFDFNDVGQTSFIWSYTIDGGPPITGSQITPTSQTVSGLLPGQLVVYTIAFVGVCTPPLTLTAYPKMNASFSYTNGMHMCLGEALPTTDLNGLPGAWNEPVITNINGNPSNYMFTPNQCGVPVTYSFYNDAHRVPTFNPIAAICQGSAAPSLPASSTNSPAIVGSWSPAAINTATVGTQSYTFTPNPGQCADPVTINVTINAKPTPAFPAYPATLCQNAAAPALPVSSNGITGTWSPSTINTATSGIKTATFLPAAGQCVSNTPVTISVNIVPNVTPTFSPIAAFCSGTAAPVLPTSSIEGITGSWSPATVSNTASASYTFTPAAGQCATTQTISITVKPIVTPNFQSSLTLCSGSPAPALTATSPNGVSGSWSPSVISNTTSASYTFTPSAGQCSPSHVLSVTITPRITPDFASALSLCIGSPPPPLLTTSPNGVTGAWSPATVNTAAAGVTNYTFTAAANQCVNSPTHVLTVTVNALTTPNFAAIAPICSGSGVPVLAGTSPNGIAGNWSPAIVSNTASGSYTFTPLANQCATTQIINVTVKPTVVPNFQTSLTLCSGSPAPILAATSPNGVTGSWSPAVISNTIGGFYTFTPSPGQCSSSHVLTVTITPRIDPDFQSALSICLGAAAPALATISPNGISGTWSPAAISTAAAGVTNYTFTAAAGQCVNSSTHTMAVTVNAITPPNFAAIAPICFGSPAPLLGNTAPNGVVGNWSPATISNTTSAVYTFTPLSNQCSTSQVLNVTVKPVVAPNFAASLSLCAGAAAPVLASVSPNGIAGTWSPATIDNIASATYIFTPNTGQCASAHTLSVTIVPLINPDFQSAMSICVGSIPPALATTSPNGISGTWSPAAINTSTPGVRNYVFTASAGECVIAPTFTLAVTVTPITIPDFAPVASFCEGTPAPVLSNTSPNGVVGTWSPAIISNTISGSYLFTPLANQCAASQILNVLVILRTVPTFSPVPAFCAGTPAPVLPLVSNNGYTGTWSPATVDNTTTTTYIFTPDAPQCATTASLVVTVNQPVDPGFSDIAFCVNAAVPPLEVVSPIGISGSWNPPAIDPASSGATYEFTPDAGECANPQTIAVTVNQLTLNDVSWVVSDYFSESATVTFTATDAGNYVYQLDNGPLSEDNVFFNVAPGTHSIAVFDVNGCAPPVIKTNEVVVIGYPHFFTPNGDGIGDYWNIFDLALINQQQATIHIFDRYGKLLKQIAPAGQGWDGTYNGQPLPSTDYWFVVSYSELGQPREFKSHFSLKR